VNQVKEQTHPSKVVHCDQLGIPYANWSGRRLRHWTYIVLVTLESVVTK
jgi:hypothetical protein